MGVPRGRVRDGESDADVLLKCLKSRIGVDAEIGQMVMEVTHEYQGYDLMMCVYQCDIGDQVPTPRKVHDVAWIAPEEFGEYAFPGADQKSVDALLGRTALE